MNTPAVNDIDDAVKYLHECREILNLSELSAEEHERIEGHAQALGCKLADLGDCCFQVEVDPHHRRYPTLQHAVTQGMDVVRKLGRIRHVDVERLRLDSCHDCVLGQLFGLYDEGLSALVHQQFCPEGDRIGWPQRHGFIHSAEIPDYATLSAEWRRQIRAALAELDAEPSRAVLDDQTGRPVDTSGMVSVNEQGWLHRG